MKIAVRALVLGMLITGFAADHMITSSAQNSNTVIVSSLSAMPIPTCEPGKSSCGLGGKR